MIRLMDTLYFVDEFVYTQIGEPFRLLPFGTITKNGRSYEITPEMAAQFSLPHFKPPIKLGSHTDTTPAGGHIVGLEVRHDGLYAIPEWNTNGTAAMVDGNYRYHSPEIAWDGDLLDSSTGKYISGPIVMGDALLHTPALGEASAFYQVSYENGGNPMAENTVPVPTRLWEGLMERLFSNDSQLTPPTPETPLLDNFAAQVETLSAQVETLTAQSGQYKAEITRLQGEQTAAQQITHFATELAETAVAEDTELITLLAGLESDTATALVQRFSALSAQIGDGVEGELGHEGDGHGSAPVTALETAVAQYQADHTGVTFNNAISALAVTQPELFEGVA